MISQAKITSKGQITIPKDIRERYHLHEGETVLLVPTEGGIVMKHGMNTIRTLRGLMKRELDMNKASNFIKELRREWRI